MLGLRKMEMSIDSVYHYVKINLFQLRYAATSFSALIAVTKSLAQKGHLSLRYQHYSPLHKTH